MEMLSYANGASQTPLLCETVGARLDQVAEATPDADALIVPFQDTHWSYDRLRRETDAFAAGLLNRVGSCLEGRVIDRESAHIGIALTKAIEFINVHASSLSKVDILTG